VETDLPNLRRYRGRLAPSPTGYLHLGHGWTFRTAQERARANSGTLVLRIEDLDAARCRTEFREAVVEDLKWFGLRWDEGPDCGGPFAPYVQSGRRGHYLAAWKKLRASGLIYPCACSRKDVLNALGAPHPGEEEPLYPGTCRPPPEIPSAPGEPAGMNWRFRVPDGEEISFHDARLGPQKAVAGVDFGDFVIWRKDNIPAYQLAVAVDDAAMEITEVVRGEDLLASTFRQILIYRALGIEPPAFYHGPLVTDARGQRLAKRHDSQSLRALRRSGIDAAAWRAGHTGTPGHAGTAGFPDRLA
jgi:glutamyl-tRNA synthetase